MNESEFFSLTKIVLTPHIYIQMKSTHKLRCTS